MSRLLPIALCALTLLAAGCGGSEETVDADRLAGRTFVAAGAEGRTLVPGSHLVLAFDADREHLGFEAGCNGMGAPSELRDGRLRLTDDPVSTAMSCGAELDDQERWFADLLAAGVAVRETDGALRLEADGVTILMRATDARQAAPTVSDTVWRLTAVGDRDGHRSPVPDAAEPPTLRLHDGQSELNTGCNTGGGPAEVTDDGFVVFGPQRLTRMACAEPERQQVEHAMTTVLGDRAALGFEGEDLIVSKDGRFLVFSAG